MGHSLFLSCSPRVMRAAVNSSAQESTRLPQGAKRIPGTSAGRSALCDILFILAPPRSFTTVVSHMLGQHPQMYGLPETHLLCAETMAEWWRLSSQTSFTFGVDELASKHPVQGAQVNIDHGLLRVVAQLYLGEQTEFSVKWASGWLRRRSHFTTGAILELLAEKVYPRILVDKSPSVVYRPEFLQRAYEMFPQAKFIHLVRHPRGQGESVMKYLRAMQRLAPVPPSHWLFHLASFPYRSASDGDMPQGVPDLDPQRAWYVLNMNICEFLKSVSDDQKKRIRGEELLAGPDRVLREIAGWMGLRTDSEAIEEMKHPERSPYACYGPAGARFGNDRFFLKRPLLRPDGAKPQRLEGPVSWRGDGQGFLAEVRELAQQFGYE